MSRRCRRYRPGFRFSTRLRAEITAWVAKQRERRPRWCELSRALDVRADAEALGSTARDAPGGASAGQSDRRTTTGKVTLVSSIGCESRASQSPMLPVH